MINLKKSVLRPLKQIEFPGLITDTEKMTLALSDKKIKHVSQRCQEIFTQRKTFSLKSHKINWSAVINFTSTNKVSISSKKKKRTLAFQKNGFYSGHVTLGNSANSFGGWKTSLGGKFSNASLL